MTVFGRRLPMMSSLILWCLVWEIVGRADLVLLFPPFSSVLASLVELVQARGDFESAETNRITAVYDVQRAFAALEAAVGRPLR